jgi:hypothetical protein
MVQMMLGRGSIASRPLRYRNQIISANCSICGISNTYTIPVDLDQDFEDTNMERDTTNDSLDFNPASHSHTPDYHRLLPALHAFARLPSPHQAYSVGHPFTLYEVLSAEYNLRYGPTPRIPYGCLVQLRPDVGSYSPTREGDIVTRAFHHYPRPADNAVGFYTVLADATYGVHGLAPGRMPQCAVMVNIGLAVPTLSCMACMSYSGGSVKVHAGRGLRLGSTHRNGRSRQASSTYGS